MLSVLIAAPSTTMIRSVYSELGSTSFTFLKFLMMFVAFAPLVAIFIVKKHNIWRKNLKYLLISSASTAVSVLVAYKAIELSTASYASIIGLLSPIMLVIVSSRLIKEKVGRRAVAGITLAAVGGVLVVALPAIMQGSVGSIFYPTATILMFINCITYPISVVYQRKANEGGVPFTVNAGFMAMVTLLFTLILAIFNNELYDILPQAINLSWQGWLAVAYTCFVVTFVARSLWIKAYENVGAASVGGLSYLQTLLGIALPIVILGEHLSLELIIGAILILLGLYIAESRSSGDGKGGKKHHFSTHRHYLTHHGRIH